MKGQQQPVSQPNQQQCGALVSVSVDKSFKSLNLSEASQVAVDKLGFTQMTEIQAKAIPHLLEGRDLVGKAKTGSGKTLAFLIPVVELVCSKLRMLQRNGTGAIIISPTRELAMQTFGVLREIVWVHPFQTCGSVMEGVSRQAEAQKLAKGVTILVATPGRLLDHLSNTPEFLTKNLQCLVIDEADRTLQIGFEEELRWIISLLPKLRQTMLFSATATNKTEELTRLALKKEPMYVGVDDTMDNADVIWNYGTDVEQIEESVLNWLANTSNPRRFDFFRKALDCLQTGEIKGAERLVINAKKRIKRKPDQEKIIEEKKRREDQVTPDSPVMLLSGDGVKTSSSVQTLTGLSLDSPRPWISKYNLNKIFIMDCEFVTTTNINSKGKFINETATVAVVNLEGEIVYEDTVFHEPGSYKVNKYTKQINGFDEDSLRYGRPLEDISNELYQLFSEALIIVCGGAADFSCTGLAIGDFDVYDIQTYWSKQKIDKYGNECLDKCGDVMYEPMSLKNTLNVLVQLFRMVYIVQKKMLWLLQKYSCIILALVA